MVRVGSPQGRFAESAALLDGSVLEDAEAWGKHLFVDFAPSSGSCTSTSVSTASSTCTDGATRTREVPDPVGQVRLRLVRADATAYADLRGATRASC